MALGRICLDTCAYSNFKRGFPKLVKLITGAHWVGVPTFVVGELCVGFRAGSRLESNLAELGEFLENPVVHELAGTREVAECYAELFHELRQAGTPIPTNDIWIAASCITSGATLVTYDNHFSKIRRLGVDVRKPETV